MPLDSLPFRLNLHRGNGRAMHFRIAEILLYRKKIRFLELRFSEASGNLPYMLLKAFGFFP